MGKKPEPDSHLFLILLGRKVRGACDAMRKTVLSWKETIQLRGQSESLLPSNLVLPKISPEDDFVPGRWALVTLLEPVHGLMNEDAPAKLRSYFQLLL